MFRKLLEGLKRRGFQLTMGVDGSGIFYLALLKAGGYYLGMFIAPFQPTTDTE